MTNIKINKDIQQGRISVAFSYVPKFVTMVKTIEGHRWHTDKKCWSFPDTNETLEKILKVLEGKEIHLDSALQDRFSASSVIARSKATRQSQDNLSLSKPSSLSPSLADWVIIRIFMW